MWPFNKIKKWLEKKAAKKVAKTIKETNMWKFLEGKKTYLVMAVTAILGAIEALNQSGATSIEIPGFVFSVLAALGLYTRAVAKPK